METWQSDDYERPLETYPGYIGLYFDGTFDPEPALQPLKDFDFTAYGRLIWKHERGRGHRLNVQLPTGPLTLLINEGDHLPDVLDQLPTVKVYVDEGPLDGGPASGGTILFFIADGVSEEAVKASIIALACALKVDLASLQATE
jgi:hypothetical protein